MASRSSTSHSRPHSAAMLPGGLRHAIGGELVGGLVHQRASEILRFGDGPRVRHSRVQAGGIRVAPLRRRLPRFSCRPRSCSDPVRTRPGWRPPRRPRHIRRVPDCAFQRQRDPLHGFGFQVADRGAHQLAKLGGIELLALARAGQEHSLGSHVRWIMQQCQVERLAGDFSRVEQFAAPKRASFCPSKTGTISAPASICSSGLLFERYLHHF